MLRDFEFRYKDIRKAQRVIASLGVSMPNGIVPQAQFDYLRKRIIAKRVKNKMVWIDARTGKVLAEFSLLKKLKEFSTTMLKKGASVLIGLAILAGSASGMEKLTKFEDTYKKTLNEIAMKESIDLEAKTNFQKDGGLVTLQIELKNKADGDKCKIGVILTESKTFQNVEFKTFSGEDKELDPKFESLCQAVYDSWVKKIDKID